MAFNIVLLEPEIPANTGNIGRTCVATGTRLHLIEPLGFRLGEKELKRAGMDYWPQLDVATYINYEDFLRGIPAPIPGWLPQRPPGYIRKLRMSRTVISCSARKAQASRKNCFWKTRSGQCGFHGGGDAFPESVPILWRSVLYEALRQNQFPGMKLEGHLTRYDWK